MMSGAIGIHYPHSNSSSLSMPSLWRAQYENDPDAHYVSLLREAVRASGLTSSAYARRVLIREPRTCRRWLRGESPIPQAVCDYLERQSTTT